MPVDRGGLQYPLGFDYDPKGLNAFTAGVEAAKRQVAELRAQASAGATVAANARQMAQNARESAGVATKAATGLGRVGTALDGVRRSSRLAGDDLRRMSDEMARGHAVARRESEALTGQVRQLSSRVDSLTGAQARATSATASLGTSLRSLVGAFAALEASRGAVGAIRAITERAIAFNSAIEQSTLGIAALLVATSNIQDAQGRTVQGAEALAVAQGLARKQLELLRRDALQTSATFEDLARAFQVAVAPGRQAGFSDDEIRKTTVAISRAASALGVAQGQLSEEIRSLLQGTISTRNTRIAAALGITNDQVKKARDQGKLFEFLQERLSAFNIAGQAAQRTFAALKANVAGAFDLTAAKASLGFFEEVKGTLGDIQASLLRPDSGGLLEPRPEALAIVRGISDGLRDATKEARAFVQSIDPARLEQLAQAVGRGLALAAAILRPIVEGLLNAAGRVGSALAPALEGLRLIAVSAHDIAATLTEWVAILFAANKLAPVFAASLTPVQAIAASAATALRAVLAAASAVAVVVGGLAAAFGLIQTQVRNNRGEFLTLANTVTTSLLAVVRFAVQIKTQIQTVVTEAVAGLSLIPGILKSVFLKALREISVALGTFAQESLASLPAEAPAQLRAGLQALALSAGLAAKGYSDALRQISDEQDATVNETKANLKRLQEDTSAFVEGLDATISETFDEKGGAALFEDPRKALAEFTADLKRGLAGATAEGLAEGAAEGLATPRREPVDGLEEATRNRWRRIALLEAEGQAAMAKNAARERALRLAEERDTGAEARQQRRIADARALIEIREAELRLLQQKALLDEAEGRKQVEEATPGLDQFTAQEEFAKKQALARESIIEVQQQIRLLAIEEQRARREVEEPVEFGLQTALDNLDVSGFQITVDVMTSAVQGFAATAASAIVDGFTDPQKDIQDSFAQLFRGLAQQLTQLLIQAALVRAIGGIAGGFAGGGEIGNAPGRARGGRINSGTFRPSLAHAGAAGLAAGGRPPGLHPTDTVPLWGAPGEFMEPKASVDEYGLPFMEAIRRRLLSSELVDVLMGSIGGRHRVHVPKPAMGRVGFASGGPIASSSARPAPRPTPAFIVASNEAAESLLRGGQQAVLRWMRDNQSGVKSALGLRS